MVEGKYAHTEPLLIDAVQIHRRVLGVEKPVGPHKIPHRQTAQFFGLENRVTRALVRDRLLSHVDSMRRGQFPGGVLRGSHSQFGCPLNRER
jgi:hypothetical protein